MKLIIKTVCLSFIYFASLVGDVNKVVFSAERIEKMCVKLHELIKNDAFTPDLIIAVSRGGLVPTGFLVNEKMFDMRNVSVICIKSYTDMKQTSMSLVMPFHIEDIKQFKSILVVDDVVDSGKTLQFIDTLLKSELPDATIRTAALIYKPKTSLVKPDYYAEENDDWVVFPWE